MRIGVWGPPKAPPVLDAFFRGSNDRSSQGMTGGFLTNMGKKQKISVMGGSGENDSDLTQVSWAATR